MSNQNLRGSAKLRLWRLAPIFIMLFLSLISTLGHAQSSAKARKWYVDLPLSFEPNRGQAGGGIDFVSHGPGYTFSLTPNRADLHFITTDRATQRVREDRTVRIKLRGANAHAHAEASEAQPGRSNYFIGNNRAAWQTDIPQYGRVEYEEVYPGIDLAYYGNRRQLEYDFVVAPRADPRRIRLAIAGADQIQIDETGDLLLKVGSAEIHQRKPVLYQDSPEGRHNVEGRYVIRGRNRVGFEVAAYDRHKSLTIDPVLVFSTYFGGNGDDIGTGIKVDATGNIYVSGTTTSTNFQGNPVPGTPSGQPLNGTGKAAFISKISSSGTLIYSSYIGGTNDQAFGAGLAVDSNGNAYLVGTTTASNFPTVNPIQSAYGGGSADAFILELNSSGNGLVYSTYLGGSALDYAEDIEVDASANAYVVGSTSSSNFPTVNAEQPNFGKANVDAFAAVISTGGASLVYSTYIGGSTGQFGNGLTIDSSGNLYAFGDTASTDFPVLNAFQPVYGGGSSDGWVVKLSPTGTMIYGTYIGGSAGDEVRGAKVDNSGNLYLVGSTASVDFPALNAIQPHYGGGANDVFVTCLNPSGSALIYSTYLGGSSDDTTGNLALDAYDNAYVVGSTSSTNFPTVNAFLTSNAGGYDAFLTKINAGGTAIVFSTYLGGGANDSARAVAVDGAGRGYVTGTTSSTNFPTANPLQATFGGGPEDAFITALATCNFAFSPPNAQFASSGGSGTVSIATTPECGWAATSNNSWITITSAASGQGSGSISYTVAPNNGSQLNGSITIGDLPFSVVEFGDSVTLASISPSSGVQGTNVPVTLTGTNFAANATVNVSGTGVTVSNVVVVSATQITVTLGIAANAPLGGYTVSVTSAGMTSNGVTFTVSTMVPVLTGLTPASGGAGNSVPVTLSGTNFVAGATLSSTNPALSFSNVNVVSPTQITATFTLASNASAGSAPVMVTTAYGTSNALGYTIQPLFVPVRVDAGSSTSYTDGLGQLWSADSGFQGGALYVVNHAVNGTPAPVLYQTVHYGGSTFTYQTAVPNGQYTVNLKFEENVYTQSGKRLFNVAINGQQVLTNFDIFAAAGAQYQAVDVPIPVTVTTGQISIQFIPLVNVAGIFGIEIVAGTPAAPTVTSITPNTGKIGTAVPVTITGTNLASDVVINAGPNVTVNNITVVNATQVTATFNIAASATAGQANVTVTTPGGTTAPSPFSITQ